MKICLFVCPAFTAYILVTMGLNFYETWWRSWDLGLIHLYQNFIKIRFDWLYQNFIKIGLFVCPAFMAYVSVTIMGWILMKLGGSVGTFLLVGLIDSINIHKKSVQLWCHYDIYACCPCYTTSYLALACDAARLVNSCATSSIPGGIKQY